MKSLHEPARQVVSQCSLEPVTRRWPRLGVEDEAVPEEKVEPALLCRSGGCDVHASAIGASGVAADP